MRLYGPQIAGLGFEPRTLSYPAVRRPGFEPGCQQWAEDFKSKPYVAVKVSVETHLEGFLCVSPIPPPTQMCQTGFEPVTPGLKVRCSTY